ncbi:hypothetical protein M514_11758 [Trichuris suis]|uniref:Uncharacterized protein n=1 Tax=Trichuris suis TaxID=68888 RepID=A0A085MVW8_9BILA|nr:hypothetical protein M513_11758 [Trichuris suis]KFD61364.1 hypothetical protein M514_11758 [Trichuris suis]
MMLSEHASSVVSGEKADGQLDYCLCRTTSGRSFFCLLLCYGSHHLRPVLGIANDLEGTVVNLRDEEYLNDELRRIERWLPQQRRAFNYPQEV